MSCVPIRKMWQRLCNGNFRARMVVMAAVVAGKRHRSARRCVSYGGCTFFFFQQKILCLLSVFSSPELFLLYESHTGDDRCFSIDTTSRYQCDHNPLLPFESCLNLT